MNKTGGMMSENAERALTYFWQRVWEAYADLYDAFRVDTGETALRIRQWSELSEVHRQLFATELEADRERFMGVVKSIGLDDAVD